MFLSLQYLISIIFQHYFAVFSIQRLLYIEETPNHCQGWCYLNVMLFGKFIEFLVFSVVQWPKASVFVQVQYRPSGAMVGLTFVPSLNSWQRSTAAITFLWT